MDYKKTLNQVSEFIVKKGDYVFENWHRMSFDSLKDGGADVTTNFDKEIEKDFSDFVYKNFPDHGFMGEEFDELKREGEYTWFIDPIDGTKFFANSIPFWSVTASLIKDGEPVLGIIYSPTSKKLYTAYEGGGAWVNDDRINLTNGVDISKLQACVDLAKTDFEWKDYTDDVMQISTKLAKDFYRIRMLGNGALSLAWLAQGFFGAFVDVIRPEKKFVDITGGLIIAKEAGAEIAKIDLGHDCYRMIVARPEVVDQIRWVLDY